MAKFERNAPCQCGSGKKYKNCCLARQITHPSQRQRGEAPLMGVPASPVGGETVLMCVHTGISGHTDPIRKIGVPPTSMSNLHFYWSTDPFEGVRPDGTEFSANWIAICDQCNRRGGPNQAPLGGDYLWPDEPPDSPAVIRPDVSTNPVGYCQCNTARNPRKKPIRTIRCTKCKAYTDHLLEGLCQDCYRARHGKVSPDSCDRCGGFGEYPECPQCGDIAS